MSRSVALLVSGLVVCGWVCLVRPAPLSAQCLATHGSVVVTGCGDAPLALSRDDGTTFAETALRVVALAVTDDDRVLAVDDADPPNLIEVGGTLREPLPVTDVASLERLGRGVVIVGRLDAEDPDALGQTLVLVRPHDGPARELGRIAEWSNSLRVSVTGTERTPRVELVFAYGLSCWGTVHVRRVTLDAHGARVADLLNDLDCSNLNQDCAGFFDVEVGAHGTAYAVRAPTPEGTERPGPLLLVRPTEQTSPTTLIIPTGATITVAHNGRVTIALLDGVLHRLEGTRATPLGGHIDANATLTYVDDRGRPYASTEAGLFRFSRRDGWVALRP